MSLATRVRPYAQLVSLVLGHPRAQASQAEAAALVRGLARPGDTALCLGSSPDVRNEAERAVGAAGRVVALSPDGVAALGESDGMPPGTRSIDALVGDLRLEPGLLVIDGRGREAAVLAGAKQTLERWRPRLVLTVGSEPQGATAVSRVLRSVGYRLSVLEHDPWGRFDLRRRCAFDPALHCRDGARTLVIAEPLLRHV